MTMGLKKELNLIDVFSISTGAMISSGLFVLPGLAYAKAGPAMILAYLLAAVLIIPSMLAKAELSTAMPRAGGTYFFIDRSLGPVLGTFGGFANWFSLSLKSAFALVGIGAFAVIVIPDITPLQIKLISVTACLIFTILNLISVKVTGRVQIILVTGLITIIVLYIGRGFVSTHPDRYIPFMPGGLWSVFSTAGLVFVSFGGLTKIASIAEEVKNPHRNVPLGMLLSFIVVTLLYILAAGVTVGIVDGAELKYSLIPLSQGAANLTGTIGTVVLSLAAIAAFITTANSGILASSRSPMAMSRDKLLPKMFSKIHPQFKTPHVSILITSGFMILVILFLSIEDLVKTASTLKIILFAMDNISVLVMRESKIQNYRPSLKVPLYPYLPIFALLSYGFLLIEMGMMPILISAGFFFCGWIGYWVYSRMRVHRTSAIMHIVERITDKELKTRTLEKELREIVIERDEIIEDRFDQLIKKCEVLDLEDSLPLKKVFEHISENLALRLGIDKQFLYDRFIERESQTSTVLSHGMAIPHVIIPGKNLFDIMLVRCKKGLSFPTTDHSVHTIFVLVGSMDERNFHLRALMAIANISHEAHFEKKWLSARNTDELKDVILLSNRKRDNEAAD
jgi:amino acid transporter/mannitol/fructose-specific phosphotransferase system IIA component (Ntr-type)